MKSRFKLDKHNPQRVYWQMREVYDFFKTNDYLNQHPPLGQHKGFWDWKITYGPRPVTSVCESNAVVEMHKKCITRGDILQPITVINGSQIIDGGHKARAYEELGLDIVPLASVIGEGTGEVLMDEVYRPLVGDLIHIGKKPLDVICVECGGKAKRNGWYFECKCGRSVREGLLGWTIPNLEEII